MTNPTREWTRGDYMISTDPGRLEIEVIHSFLSRSYWAMGVPRDIVVRSIQGSMPFGIYQRSQQVGFARVITDQATFAYVADVFVLESHRGQGLARWLMRCILQTPELQGLRRWLLVTRDAHPIYRDVGFSSVDQPGGFMEIVRRDLYQLPPEKLEP